MRLFGFEFNLKKKEEELENVKSPIPAAHDGSIQTLNSFNNVRSVFQLDNVFKSEYETINYYRYMAQNPIISDAVEEICNEAIVNDEKNSPVQINLDNLEVSEKIKKKLTEEFEYILNLLDFETKAYEIFRDWYIDSRIIYQKLIDPDKTKDGILELRKLDPRRVIKIKDYVIEREGDVEYFVLKDEYYIYSNSSINHDEAADDRYGYSSTFTNLNTRSFTSQDLKLHKDSISFIHSGLIDQTSNVITGYLHKATKPFNQLNLLEDSAVIYRLVRAPERLAFYIDTGNMPPPQAQAWVENIASGMKNTISYDSATGAQNNDKKMMAMQDNYYLPRREGGKGTEIQSIAGGQNLGDLEDINYFNDKLVRSLYVPPSRFNNDGGAFGFGKESEISRDEIKFSKFISRLRMQFSSLFYDLLKSQCVLKNHIKEEEWDDLKHQIKFDFVSDTYFAEIKEAEMFKSRIETANFAKDYEGAFYSREYIRKNILRQTDDDIKAIDQQIKKEQGQGIIPDAEEVKDKMYNMDFDSKPDEIEEIE